MHPLSWFYVHFLWIFNAEEAGVGREEEGRGGQPLQGSSSSYKGSLHKGAMLDLQAFMEPC